jgi:NTE family protein
VRHAINELYKLLPPELACTEQAKLLYEYGCVTEMDIVRLIYRPVEPQGASKTYDFSARRWKSGGGRGRLTRVLCCTRRPGSRRHQRSWACVCSMC